jgi:hypothetical protein
VAAFEGFANSLEEDLRQIDSMRLDWKASQSKAVAMPAEARGHVRKLPSGKWQLRYYDAKGGHRSGGAFSTKSEAWAHYRDVIEPELRGRPVARRDLTFSELVEVFLERHAIVAKPRTITELRRRLKQSGEKFGEIPLVELEGMADEIVGWPRRSGNACGTRSWLRCGKRSRLASATAT